MNDRVPPLSYAPDGLYEPDVDALIGEYFTTDPAPYTVADQPATHRHVRLLTRQNTSAALRGRPVEPHQTDAGGTAA